MSRITDVHGDLQAEISGSLFTSPLERGRAAAHIQAAQIFNLFAIALIPVGIFCSLIFTFKYRLNDVARRTACIV